MRALVIILVSTLVGVLTITALSEPNPSTFTTQEVAQ